MDDLPGFRCSAVRLACSDILRAVRAAPPVDASKRQAMQAQRERDTSPELALRRALFSRGLRYRVHRRVVPGVRRTLDVVFPTEKVAVEVRGCFWHACPRHATWPKHNAEWWSEKLTRNRARDKDTEERLKSAGWKVVIVWEHEDAQRAAQRVLHVVETRRRRLQARSRRRESAAAARSRATAPGK